MRSAIESAPRLRSDLLQANAGAVYHRRASPRVGTGEATDLPSLLALIVAMCGSFNRHVANVAGVHGADSGNRVEASAVDTGSAANAPQDIARALRSHAASMPAHLAVDPLAGWKHVRAKGSDVRALCRCANALRAALNAHYAAALSSGVAA